MTVTVNLSLTAEEAGRLRGLLTGQAVAPVASQPRGALDESLLAKLEAASPPEPVEPQGPGTVERDGDSIQAAKKVEADLSMPVAGDRESGDAAAEMREREAEDSAS